MTTLPDFIRPVTEGETVTEAPAVEKAGWGLMAEFETPAEIMAAAKSARDQGFRWWDTHTPYPVHGLDKAMGIKPTILPLLVLGGGHGFGERLHLAVVHQCHQLRFLGVGSHPWIRLPHLGQATAFHAGLDSRDVRTHDLAVRGRLRHLAVDSLRLAPVVSPHLAIAPVCPGHR